MTKGSFFSWPGVGLQDCDEIQREGFRRFVVGCRGFDERGARLVVPTRKLGQIPPRSFGETGHEILDRRRRSIVAFEIKIHAFAKGIVADEHLQHADDFGAFFIDRGGVEIVDFQISVRPDIMRERPGVLGKLLGAQSAHIG